MEFKKEKDILTQLKLKVKQETRGGKPFPVALDADGTLWSQDINHILLHYQEDNKLLKGRDLLSSYKGDDQRWSRCTEFAKRQSLFSLKEFRVQSREALKKTPLTFFPFIKKLVSFLKEEGAQIFIVTASLRYLVEEALNLYSFPYHRVLGIETKVKEGRLTSILTEPVTYAEGKREAFLKATGGENPLLSGGNSGSDQPLLEISKIAFVVNSVSEESENFLSEQKMKKWSEDNNQFLFEKI